MAYIQDNDPTTHLCVYEFFLLAADLLTCLVIYLPS